jgi:tetratricopeptide (TPR) repeat protein
VAILAACLAGGVAVGAMALAPAVRPSEVCTGAAAELVGVWDAEIIARAEQRFGTAAQPFARAAWRTARRHLDAYATAWVAAQQETCRATRVRRNQSEAMMDRRMACLEQRRQELAAAAALLADADADTMRHAAAIASTPGAIDSCSDLATLGALALPADPQARATVAELRRQLARVDGLRAAGKPDAGIILSAPLAIRAAVLGYRPLEAEVLYTQGLMWDQRAGPKIASALYSRAIFAAEAGGDDEYAARGWLKIMTAAARQGHWADVDAAMSRARAAVERGKANPRLAMYLEFGLGLVRMRQGKAEEAAVAYDEVARLAEKLLGPADPLLTTAVNEAGIALEHLGRYDEARAHYLRARTLQEASIGPAHPDYALSLLNLAVIAERVEHYGEAMAYLVAAHAIIERSIGPSQSLADIESELGNVGIRLGHYAEAAAHYRQATSIGAKVLGANNPIMGRYLSNLGIALRLGGDLAAAREAQEHALAIGRAAYGDHHPQVASAMISLGLVHEEQGDLAGAAALYQQARDIFLVSRPSSVELAMAWLNISSTRLAQHRPLEALDAALAAVAIDDKLYDADQPSRATALTYAAQAEVALGRLPSARLRYRRAIELMSAGEGDYQEELIDARLHLAAIDRPHAAELRAAARAACASFPAPPDLCKP